MIPVSCGGDVVGVGGFVGGNGECKSYTQTNASRGEWVSECIESTHFFLSTYINYLNINNVKN